ncbi:MAG: hypothetical protein U9R25_17960 [Chloroflexota bacterium]|nr:hypothetical protein [Chloroflexota bacterium]
MSLMRNLTVFLVLALFVAACGTPGISQESGRPIIAPQPDSVPPYVLDGPLTVQAFDKDREVLPDTDENFEFLVVNHTESDLPVVMVLEHEQGVRWPTSLCVDKQCLLGDGSEASTTDPVVIPPYLELPFQAHIFVGSEAKSGQRETLSLRIEPQRDGVEARSLTLSAVVVGAK